jgi:anti-sigma factor RsiW
VTDCVNREAREALPDLLHGRLSALDTATMNAHVESCTACRAELELLREIRSSAPLAPSLDYARIAASVPAYGGAAVAIPSRPSIRAGLRNIALIAASAVVAFTGWSIARPGDDARAVVSPAAVASAPVAPAPSPATSVATTSPGVSTPATEIVQGETQVASLSLVGSIQDLSDADLEQLVSDLEGLDALPSAEPQSVTLSVEDIGADQ